MFEGTSRTRVAAATRAAAIVAISLKVFVCGAVQAEPIGTIERVVNEATVFSESAERAATAGSRIRQGDLLQTGETGSVAVLFRDGSRLMVGSGARLGVSGFVPEQGRRPGALIITLEAGAMRLVAARAERAPARRLEVRSGAATVSSEEAVDVWCGLESGKLSVLLLSGRVRVGNWSGSVMVERRRAGTLVDNLITPPEPAYGWDRERIRRALVSVGTE